MAKRLDDLRSKIDELSALDERRGYLRAQLEQLLDADPEPPPARPRSQPPATPPPRRSPRARSTSTPGLRQFVEQLISKKGLDVLTVSRKELRADVLSQYPGVPEDVLMARLSNNLKVLRTTPPAVAASSH